MKNQINNQVIQQAITSISFLSKMNYIFYLKDINGHYLAATDYTAKVLGYSGAQELIGKSTKELIGTEHPKFADQLIELDNYLINNEINNITSISFFSYKDNVNARLVIRNKLIDPETGTILGILYQELPSGLNNELLAIIDSFDEANLDIRQIEQSPSQVTSQLTLYEQEICFLVAIGWSPAQIRTFLNKLYPDHERTLDAIIKKKNAICRKFDIEFNHISHLREFLVQNGVYKQIPSNLLNHLQGSYLIN